ncbi:hypothetical protein N9J70_04000 [Gammaproteobacteria bacterium]|nr:hypothetical protein [Gammaproteobacteria bacterium]MDA9113789.1 hypothetical protein [Gammaproteobacteria bacterium]
MEKLQPEVVRLTKSSIGNQIKLLDIKNEQSWSVLLNGIDTFIHLAERAHVLDYKADNPLDESQK